ncbi:putative Diacylglycerol O-acyltransferase [Rhodotorula taiwanensis]|uniref:diacylglycerol O-acyltransferase n=1 Tax=Rhodotorula taiwanensis TaxID=741276 RepID=A0A2S5B343_9BASI|nr:putative Diacylglycerol O-acyltransferase [Rhodotorula taiwanensis]
MLAASLGIFFILCSIPPFWPLILAYLTWVFCIDKAPIHGGRPQQWLRKSRFWVWFAGYYPVSLIKPNVLHGLRDKQTAELPPDRKYVFGYHPHGVIGMGAIANFGTDATGFSRLFPGLTPHLLTLANNFNLPLYRELLLGLGIASVSMRSCQNILRKGPGSTITIVVGGAAESLSAHPGTADLTLKRRKGFIKLAIRQGADLVPIFQQMSNQRGSRLYKAQKKFQSVFGFTLHNMGLMPYRHPIVSVVGKPISVKQKDHPTDADLDEVQARYIAELKSIWESHKEIYAKSRTKELSIIA